MSDPRPLPETIPAGMEGHLADAAHLHDVVEAVEAAIGFPVPEERP